MKVAFYASPKSRCQAFAQLFAKGLEKHGHSMLLCNINDQPRDDVDASVILGVQNRYTFDCMKSLRMPFVYLDKGYTRTWDYRRVAINDAQPTAYMQYWTMPDDRRSKFGWSFEPWRRDGNHIVISTSSKNYHAFSNIEPPEVHTQRVFEELRDYTDRPIIFRPKPNQTIKIEVPGTTLSTRTLQEDLAGAHCLITYGSSSCIEAMRMGVPSIILGDAVMRPISSYRLKYVESPCYATDSERDHVLNALAYCQWSLDEFASGEAWAHIERGLV